MVGVDYETAFERLVAVWTAPVVYYCYGERAATISTSRYYVEISLPKLHWVFEKHFDNYPKAFYELGDCELFYLPLKYVVSAISRVPPKEFSINQGLIVLENLGFVIRQQEELN